MALNETEEARCLELATEMAREAGGVLLEHLGRLDPREITSKSAARDLVTAADVASERRLLYVSMTRARKALHLLAPETPDKPLRECAERELASVFERELGVARAQDIVEAASQRADELILHSRDGALPHWLPDYLTHLNIPDIPLRFEGTKTESKGIKRPGGIIDRKYKDAGQLRKVLHDTLGEGVLVSEDKDYLKVRFNGETKIRTLARDVVMDKIRLL